MGRWKAGWLVEVGRKTKRAGGLSRPVKVVWGGPVDFNRKVWAQTDKEVFPISYTLTPIQTLDSNSK
jgi:hypothetical protein